MPIDLPKAQVAAFDTERTHLNIAAGAALDVLLPASSSAVAEESPAPVAPVNAPTDRANANAAPAAAMV